MPEKKLRKDVRTTLSLAEVVWDMAQDLMDEKGFNDNFSAYIADLIRRDMEGRQGRTAKKTNSSSKTERKLTELLDKGLAREKSDRSAGDPPKGKQ